jgi:hypothetical protein
MRAGVAIVVYVLLLGMSLARLVPRPGFAAGEAAAGMIVFGLALSAAAWAATAGASPRPIVVRHAGRELAAITAYLFRAAFQARAAAWLRSEVAAIVAMAVLFGLAHAPGYVLRGAHAMEGFAEAPDPLTAAAYSIVVVSPVGLAFGVLWARTRSLTLVVLLHGWGDLVPNLAPFVRAWLR